MKKLSKFEATQTGSVIPSLFWQTTFVFNIFIRLDLYEVKRLFRSMNCMPFAFHYFKLLPLFLFLAEYK